MRNGAPKVLFAITKSNWGGAQAYVYDLAVAARDHGMETAVVAGGDGLLIERLTEAGIQTLPLTELLRDVEMLTDHQSLFRPQAIFRSIQQEFSVLMTLIRIFKEERPDIVHLNSSKMGGVGALAARLAGVPRIIFTAHGWPHKEPRPFPVKLVIRLLSWVTVLLSHKVIAVSENDVQESPVVFSRKKVALVRNGLSTYEPLPRTVARKELGIPTTAAVILSIAELHKNKGIASAIAAFAEVTEHHPDWLYYVIGEGEERAHLEALITHLHLEERVFLLGFKPEAKRYLLASDLFLLPSRKEGLPITLLEAGRAGLPVVASRTGGIPEVIRHKETGLLAPPHNPHALARALRMMIEHPDEARRYAEALKSHVTEQFSKERMVDETFALYTDIEEFKKR